MEVLNMGWVQIALGVLAATMLFILVFAVKAARKNSHSSNRDEQQSYKPQRDIWNIYSPQQSPPVQFIDGIGELLSVHADDEDDDEPTDPYIDIDVILEREAATIVEPPKESTQEQVVCRPIVQVEEGDSEDDQLWDSLSVN